MFVFDLPLKDYSTEGMSESQSKFLQHLREFGLVFQRKVGLYTLCGSFEGCIKSKTRPEFWLDWSRLQL